MRIISATYKLFSILVGNTVISSQSGWTTKVPGTFVVTVTVLRAPPAAEMLIQSVDGFIVKTASPS